MSAGRRLQPSLREEFQKPVGRDIGISELRTIDAKLIIAVGDVVSLTMRENGIVPLLSVYDGYTERRELTGFADLVRNTGLEETVVSNPAGTVTSQLEDAVENALAGRSAGIIRVEGEEDLALLPCVLHAPEGAVVVYGWPGRGMKAVATDGSSRKWAEEMLGRMEELS
ncbi:archaeal conserved hypothetical protein [Thermoplasmatales archaeon BRNA1]|nr:archaeal conserved hypothetical protein [Thermoplasmatales archaeon BRNA1]